MVLKVVNSETHIFKLFQTVGQLKPKDLLKIQPMEKKNIQKCRVKSFRKSIL